MNINPKPIRARVSSDPIRQTESTATSTAPYLIYFSSCSAWVGGVFIRSFAKSLAAMDIISAGSFLNADSIRRACCGVYFTRRAHFPIFRRWANASRLLLLIASTQTLLIASTQTPIISPVVKLTRTTRGIVFFFRMTTAAVSVHLIPPRLWIGALNRIGWDGGESIGKVCVSDTGKKLILPRSHARE